MDGIASVFQFTKLSRATAVILAAGYVAQLLAPSVREYAALVPGRTLPCVWNFFTAGLLEVHILMLLLNMVGVLLLAKVIEPIWGSRDFVKFVAIVNVCTGFSTFVLLYICYAVTMDGTILYKQVCGFHGIFAGLLVALKQVLPESEVTLVGFLKFRAKHLPALFVLISTAAAAFYKDILGNVPFIMFGTYTSWLYLRFFQWKPELGLKGDPSDEFRFATFFPEVLRGPIDILAHLFSRVFRLGLREANGQPHSRQGFKPGSQPLPGSDTAEAARRRERGARALEERLNLKKASTNKPGKSDSPKATPQVATDIETGQPEIEDASQ